jgi:hypothetical protein
MQKKTYAILWKFTGLVAFWLLIATFILAYKANNLPDTGLYGALTSSNPTIYLRAEPSGNSKIVTILERGMRVYIIDAVADQSVRWMKIETGHFSGWIPEANLVFENE